MKHIAIFEDFDPNSNLRVIQEHEEGEDIIISYSDMDYQVEMKGILKEKFSTVSREYQQYFTPVPGGWSSTQRDATNYYNPSAEKFIQRMQKAYEDNIGRDLAFFNDSGLGWGADNTEYGTRMEVRIPQIFPVPLEVRITKY